MKKIILSGLIIVLSIYSCKKSGTPQDDSVLKNHNAALVKDWIAVQLKVIKNSTGIQHVAYSRPFAYTGIALYETLVNGDKHYSSIAGKLNGINLLNIQPGQSVYWPAAANAAVAAVLRHFYPAKVANIQTIDSLEQIYFTKYSADVNDNSKMQDAIAFGKQVALAVINWSEMDGSQNANSPYTPLGEGYWEPTPAGFAAPAVPGWGNNRTILPNIITNTIPAAPIGFSKETGTPFYNMVKEVYDVSQSLTDEQKAIANFWDDAPNGKYVSAFGHWFNILRQTLEKENSNLMAAADAYLRLGISMHEAGISCWKTKYTYNLLRPITYIRKHMGLTSWNAFISTPPHPEYSAAHATLSGAAGYALESSFGKNYHFTDHTYDEIGMQPRTFTSFDAAGAEAGISRLYGGIHYRPSIETGNAQGKKVAENVKLALKTK